MMKRSASSHLQEAPWRPLWSGLDRAVSISGAVGVGAASVVERIIAGRNQSCGEDIEAEATSSIQPVEKLKQPDSINLHPRQLRLGLWCGGPLHQRYRRFPQR